MVLLLFFIIILLIIPITWLNSRQNRMHSILEQSQEAIVVVNRKGIIKYANPATKKITGLEPSEILKKSLKKVLNLHHLEDLSQIIQQRKQQVHTCDTLIIGTEKTIHIEMFILPIVKNKIVREAVVFLHNVTDRVLYENRLKESLSVIKNQNIQLQELKNRAESANHAKDIFLANMSHEFLTPLNGVVGAISLLNTTVLDQDQLNYLNIMKQSTDHLNRMISEILDLTKMESGQFTLHPKTFKPKDFFTRCAAPFQQDAQKKGLQMIIENDFLPDDEFVGDHKRLQQILFHLLSNAVKFTEKGKIYLKITKEKTQLNKESFKLVIEDAGIGVAPNEAKIIFTKFTQIDSTSTKKFSGIGHGLYFVKKLIDLMKGSIHLEPCKKGGARFTVLLPFDRNKPLNNLK